MIMIMLIVWREVVLAAATEVAKSILEEALELVLRGDTK